MTDATAEPTIDSILDAAMNAGEKTVTLPTALLLTLYQDAAEGVLLAEGVITNWSGGDLAGAVNALEGWVEGMTADYDDMDPSAAADDEDDEAPAPEVDPDLGLTEPFDVIQITDARPWTPQRGKVVPGFYYLNDADELMGPFDTADAARAAVPPIGQRRAR